MRPSFSSPNFLTELTKPENHPFREEFSARNYPPNTPLFAPDHEENLVFVIKTGRVQVYLAVDGKEFSLAILGPGDIYATHTRAHVKALDDIVLLVIPTERLHARMSSHPSLSFTIIAVLGQLLKQSFSIIDQLVFQDCNQRLTRFLLHEANHNGTTSEGGISINPALTTTQMAAIVGSSRQTVSKIINGMFQEGVLIRKKDGSYLIPDLTLLEKRPFKEGN
jgi:CRP-like cAMP-binding protein